MGYDSYEERKKSEATQIIYSFSPFKIGELWDINSEFIRPTSWSVAKIVHMGWFVQKLTIYTKKRKEKKKSELSLINKREVYSPVAKLHKLWNKLSVS